jgi:hypothetical protein
VVRSNDGNDAANDDGFINDLTNVHNNIVGANGLSSYIAADAFGLALSLAAAATILTSVLVLLLLSDDVMDDEDEDKDEDEVFRMSCSLLLNSFGISLPIVFGDVSQLPDTPIVAAVDAGNDGDDAIGMGLLDECPLILPLLVLFILDVGVDGADVVFGEVLLVLVVFDEAIDGIACGVR